MYAVIANIAQNVGGLNWAAKAGDGRQWTIPNYFPDHTYPDREAYGACLMINCAGIPGEKLYERTIEGLCDKKLTVKCFINNFSDGGTPVKVKIRITEIKPDGTDGISEESAEITRYADGADGIAWKEVSVDIDLPSLSNSIRFEVFSSQSGASGGNDLLLDDIQIYTCSSPSVSLYFNSGLTETVTETCEGDDVILYVDETPMLTNYFGAQLSYIFQYTYDDPSSFTFDQKSYKNIAPAPIQATSKDDLESIFDAFKALFADPNGKKMYFRVVSGDMSRLTALNAQPGFFFNQNEACADYGVSDPIEASINCQACEKPATLLITSSLATSGTAVDGTRIVRLCEAESTDLTATATHPDYSDYTISWHIGSKTAAATDLKPGMTSALTVNYGDVTETGVKYFIRVSDNFIDDYKCAEWDSILIVANPIPVASVTEAIYVVCEGASLVLDGTPSTEASEYVWSGPGFTTPTTTLIPTVEVTSTAASTHSGTYTLKVISSAGCEHDTTFAVKVTAILDPGAIGADQTICEGTSPAELTETTAVSGGSAPFDYQWQSSTDGTAWADIAGATTGTYQPVALTADIHYRRGVLSCAGWVYTAPVKITVTKEPKITLTTANATQTGLCEGVSIANIIYELSGGSTGATIVWDVEPGLTFDVTGTKVTLSGTPNASGTFKYTITTSKDATNVCAVATEAGEIEIKAISDAPTAASYEKCPSKTSEKVKWISLVTGDDIKWYTAETGGSPIAEPADFDKSDKGFKQTYWVSQTSAGKCESSERAEVIVSIDDEPATPTITKYDKCAVTASGATEDWKKVVSDSYTLDGSETLLWYTDKSDADADALVESGSESRYMTTAPTTFPVDGEYLQSYYVIIKDAGGCKTNPALVEVEIKARPTAVLSGDKTICKGESADLTITLTGKSPFTFTYNDGTTTKTASTSPVTVSPDATSTYKLVSLEDANCLAEATDLSGTATITVNDIPVLTGAVTVTPICSGGNLTEPSAPSVAWNGSTGTTRWEIGQGATFTEITTFPYAVSDLDNGKILRYIARNDCGESVPASVTLVVNALPQDKLVDPAKFCEGNALQPDMKIPGHPTYTINWASGSAPVVNDQKASSSPNTFEYTVTDDNGCTGTVQTYTVEVEANPSAPTVNNEIRYLRDDVQANGQFKDPKSHDPGAVTATHTLLWSSDGGATWSETPATPATPAATDYTDKHLTYLVKQKLSGALGCESPTAEVKIGIYLIPTPITPNISYCEGETTNPLTTTVKVNPAGGVSESNLELRWYGTGSTPSGTFETTPPTVNAATAGKTTYWVSQFNTATTTESGIVSFDVTVYEKPKFTITPPAPVCSPLTVNITDKWTVTNNGSNSFPELAKYYDKDGNDITSSANSLKTVGKNNYYIEVAFEMPNTKQGLDYCTSSPVPVTVDIRELEIELPDAGTCPNREAVLEVNFKKENNLSTLVYTWSGSNGENETTGSSKFTTQPLAGAPDEQYTFTVEVTDGVCTATAGNKITLGNGPVNGDMIVSEDNNGELPVTFSSMKTQEFYTCGGEVSIKTTYESLDEDGNPNPESNFVWKLNNTVVNTGRNYTITDMDQFLTRTYTIEYTNKCATSVEVTVHSVPLEITDVIVTPSMNLCEGKPFSAELKIESGETPTIEWITPSSVTSPKDQKTLTIGATRYDHSGIYSYVVTNRGCKEEGTLGQLNVSGAISFAESETPAICAGNEVEVKLDTVTTSEGNIPKLMWRDPLGAPSTIEGANNGLSITAIPPFTVLNANENRRSTYYYTVVAVNNYCTDSIEVPVYVDEPLKAELENPAPICEGASTSVNASAYDAETYTWTTSLDTVARSGGAILTVRPDTTVFYYVSMTRGICQAADTILVTVNTNPRIDTIAEISIRDREIVMREGYGTEPFRYSVDQQIPDFDPIKRDLKFGWHKFYVEDENGCKTDAYNYEVPAPPIFPDAYVSPNGDGQNDRWTVGNLREAYPDAVVIIYDRFGKQLVQYRGEEEGWDGKYLGKDMPTTDYWYVIDIEEIDKQYVGHFTLLRQ